MILLYDLYINIELYQIMIINGIRYVTIRYVTVRYVTIMYMH